MEKRMKLSKFTLNLLFVAIGTFIFFTAIPAANAQEPGNGKNLGLGIALGSPSGLTGKYYLNQKNAIQATLGLGFVGGNHLNFSLDYLYHLNLLGKSAFKLDGYIGIGGFVWMWFDDNDGSANDDKSNIGIGVRVPIGVAMIFKSIPLDIYLELAPALRVIGRTGFGFQGAIGVRYYF
jgi:Protein of unknown function (DUF3996)